MRRIPLVFAAVAMAAGIVAGARLHAGWLAPIAARTVALLALNLVLVRRSALPSTVALAALFVLIGVLLACADAHPPPADDLRRLFGESPSFARIRGRVVEDIRVWDAPQDGGEPASFRFVLRVNALHRDGTWMPATGRLLVAVRSRGPGTTAVPGYSDAVEVAGGVRRPDMGRFPGRGCPRSVLARRGIHYRMTCRGGEDLRLLPAGRPAAAALQGARAALLDRVTRGVEEDAQVRGVLAGMLLGYRQEIPGSVSDPFSTVGAMHIFAISGLHVGLLAVVLDFAFRLVRVPRGFRPLLVLPLLLLYILMTGARVSAVRAFIMTAAFLVGRSFALPLDLLNILGLAALVLLAWAPVQVFDVGFQLSFGVVAALILVVRPVQRFFLRAVEPDPFLPRSLVSRRRRRFLRWIGGPAGVGAASFGAWLGSVPLSAAYFHLLPPIAVIGNMIVVPLATLAVALGLMSVLAGFVLPWLGVTVNLANGLVVRAMIVSVGALGRVPGGHLYLRAFPLWLAIAWYGCLAACFGPVRWRRVMRRWLPVGMALGALAGLAVYVTDRRVEVTFLALDGGESIFVDGPRSADLLVDTGRAWTADGTVIRHLRGRGVDRLEAGLLTHPDAMHTGGAGRVLSRVASRGWWSPGPFLRVWERRGLVPPVRPAEDGFLLLDAEGIAARLSFEPWRGGAFDSGASAVTVSTPHAALVLTSDAPIAAVRRALATIGDLPVVLQLPDHGRWADGIDDLLKSVRPVFCVAVTGAHEARGAPDARVLRRLETLGIPWRATHRDGSIVVRLEGPRIEVESWAPDRERESPNLLQIDLPAR